MPATKRYPRDTLPPEPREVSLAAETATIENDPAQWISLIARQQDRTSFVSLFVCYAPRVKGYLLRHGVSASIAEDLAQETLLTVWRKAAQFDPERASAAAWIFTIARNRWVDIMRGDQRRGDGRIAEPLGSQTTPEDELSKLEVEARLRAALRTLPAEQSEILRLSYFEDRTHAEIAERLQLPLGTVKSRIRLANAHLRSALDGCA